MTHRSGRYGRKFNRAGIDPRGQWAAGTPASGGFTPAAGVRFAANADPLACPPHAPCDSTDESGRTFSGVSCPPHAACTSTDESGRTFSRTGKSKGRRGLRSGSSRRRK